MSDKAILKRIVERKAVIKPCGSSAAQSYAAYPMGDRRRRPIGWIDNERLRRMLADGVIHKTKKGYEVANMAARRIRSQKFNTHAAQHRDMETQTQTDAFGLFRPVHVNQTTKSVLRRLHKTMGPDGKPFLSAAELEAGERLSTDHGRSMLSLSVTQNYENVGGSGGSRGPEDAAAAIIDARLRYHEAINFVGPGLDRAVTAICCKEMGVEELEQAEGWAKRSGKTVLKLGLQRLAEFYGTHVGQAAASKA